MFVLKIKLYPFCLLFAVLITACKCDEADIEIPAGVARTVLVYLGTDNNFRSEAKQKIETLRINRDKYTDGDLLVYADAGGYPALVHIYRHPQKGNIADTIETYPPENSAGVQTFARVLNDAKAYRPANSCGLVVLSHASGWLPAAMSKPSPALRSVIWDTGTDETDNYMELSTFAEAIPGKLDFIVFDACFMGSVEVAYELKDKTDYIVASPAEVISPGFVYATMMQHLFQAQPDLTAVAKDFYEYYNNLSGLYRSATVSVVKTAELEALADIFREAAGQVRDDTDMPEDIQNYGYGTQKIYFDLGDYIQKTSPDRYNEFQAALDRCVPYKAHTAYYYSAGTETMQPVRAFSGLSVYIPQPEYPSAGESYQTLKWTKKITAGEP